ncbi:hypothetical protein BGZ72_001492, partial [Mortierella alpina]
DIACIDLQESRLVDTKLELSILLPKELRQQQRIRKTVVILPHPNVMYCPVAAFQEYYRRVAHALVPVPHYKDPEQLYIPLVRNLRDLKQALTVDRINNHHKHYLEMILRPPNTPRLKARAIFSKSNLPMSCTITHLFYPKDKDSRHSPQLQQRSTDYPYI